MLATIALLSVLPSVYCSDILDFNWRFLPKFEEGKFYNRIDKHDDDNLESDYGIFTDDNKPKFQTEDTTHMTRKVSKSPHANYKSSPKVNKINHILKNYLAQLCTGKFKDVRKNEESKIFDESVWNVKNKTKSFLSLFQIVKFPNTGCTATLNGNIYTGTCYHETECGSMNGTNAGSCANGYGVCCVFRYSCGTASNQNCTYFESPGYPDYDPPGSMVIPPTTTTPLPTPDPRFQYLNRTGRQQIDTSRSCSINIYKQSNNIQQLRIDFEDLELRSPTNGNCIEEMLIISGQNINGIPVICGYNTGQHVYVDVAALNGPLLLSVLSMTGARKRFKIRICQIMSTCSSSNNCLQYYTGTSGVISSFNYDQAALLNRSQPGYFNNLNYAICIRREAGYCSITYTNTPRGMEYPFQFRNLDETGGSTVPRGQAGVDIVNCPDDYIVIGGIRLCGDKFNDGSLIEAFTMNAPVTDSTGGPIVIPVRTDQTDTGIGFRLFYTQNRCPNM